jgi:hypothetical protein
LSDTRIELGTLPHIETPAACYNHAIHGHHAPRRKFISSYCLCDVIVTFVLRIFWKDTSRYESVTLHLKTLHWLPVRYRIEFKIAAFTYRCVYGLDHSYLVELVTPYVPSRELKSTDSCTLARLRSRLWKGRYINQLHYYYIIIIITVSPRTRCTVQLPNLKF